MYISCDFVLYSESSPSHHTVCGPAAQGRLDLRRGPHRDFSLPRREGRAILIVREWTSGPALVSRVPEQERRARGGAGMRFALVMGEPGRSPGCESEERRGCTQGRRGVRHLAALRL
jgi:hypothetical protein